MTLPSAAASPAAENDPAIVDPAAVPVAVEAPAVEPDANAADPSTAEPEDAKKPASLLDVVKSAVEKPAEPEAPSAPEGKQAEPEAEEPAAKVETDAEADAKLPFHNHPRWQEMLAERDSLREPAKRMNLITEFMQEKGLTNEEVAEGYEVMGLLKGGPSDLAKARQWFAERLDALDGMLGNVLPDDLQARVDDGLLDADGAAELARARAETALRKTQESRATERETATAAERDTAAKTTAMVDAVQAWETRTKASDPDYPKKAKLVQDRCRSIVAAPGGKAPTSAEEATALVDRALAEINAEFKAALPKPRPINPAPAGSATPATAAPATLREAINAVVGR